MSSDPIIFICGSQSDHTCDDDGPAIVIYSDGRCEKELAARQRKDFPSGIVAGSVTCSKCGASPLEDLRAWA